MPDAASDGRYTHSRGKNQAFALLLTTAAAIGLAAAQAPSPEPAQESSAKTTPARESSLVAKGAAADPALASQARATLQARCVACHNNELKQSGLDLSSREALLKGGHRGPAIVAGNAEASLLVKMVRHQQTPHMPFSGDKLSDSDVNNLAEWVNAGAPYGSGDPIAEHGEQKLATSTDHWAFQRPKRPAVPAVKNQKWVRNAIDAFIAAEHEARGLTPLPAAGKGTLLRRVYLDLVGLPPSPAQLEAFLADSSEGAYEKVADDLLNSPRYGERWGRHWMDIWRYSDWYGFRQINELRNGQHHIWRWRDWIIDSVTADKGYDRMILEMLAGDEIAPNDPETLRATGYLARNWYRFNRNVWLQDTVDHTASGFLGITMKCARCHDHKYDPISQEDYYRFRAVFEPHDVRTDRVPGEADLTKAGLPRVFDADLGVETFRFIAGDEAKPDKDKSLGPGVPRIITGSDLAIQPVSLNLEARYPDFRPFVQDDLVRQAKSRIQTAEENLAKAREERDTAKRQVAGEIPESKPGLEPPSAQPGAAEAKSADGKQEKQKEIDPATRLKNAEAAAALAEKILATTQASLPALEARIAADKAKYPSPTADAEALALTAKKLERIAEMRLAEESLLRVQQLLEASNSIEDPLDKEVEKQLAKAREQLEAAQKALTAHPVYTPVGEIYPDTSTGRRLALAKWIASEDNPLTARVAVNHIWLRHFGSALVPTVADFGLSGTKPTHPQLLDWLATELMAKKWSTKAIHRLIVTSNAYRMQSSTLGDTAANLSSDPDNHYLWRMNPRRMEAEAVRDSVLHIAGNLNTAMGGPEIDQSQGDTVPRRSVYFQHTPDVQMTFLKMFDLASPLECYERLETVMPQQALALANSKLGLAQSRLLAKNLTEKTGGPARAKNFIDVAFRYVLGRAPTKAEQERSLGFLQQQAEKLADTQALTAFDSGEPVAVAPAAEPWLRARENLVHVLFNHNEFVTIR